RIQTARINQVGPFDPNDLFGPPGFGAANFVTPSGPFAYTVLFENKPDATAPAVQVVVTEQLDPNLDWSTFELDSFGFRDQRFDVPRGRRFYSARIDDTAVTGEFVDVTARFDATTGMLTWTFQSIDPATGAAPTAIDAGFLPQDKTAPEGEGFITYRVQPRAALATTATVSAQASVVFDNNPELATPTYVNTIDAGAPTSSVAALPAASAATFPVTWSGSDDAGGSDIATYEVFVSDNGGPFTLFQPATTQTRASFTGVPGHTYGFYSVATDNVGHVQPTPAAAQATVHVPVPVTVSLQVSARAVVPGQPVTFSVTVTGSAGTPTGTVTLTGLHGQTRTLSLQAGTTTFRAALPLGRFTVSASYGGDGTFRAGGSAPTTLVVQSIVREPDPRHRGK